MQMIPIVTLHHTSMLASRSKTSGKLGRADHEWKCDLAYSSPNS